MAKKPSCELLLDLNTYQLPHSQDFKEKHINIPCPYCKATLFRARPIADNVTAIHIDDPHVQHEEGEYYAICPSCEKRVLMELFPGGPSGTSFRVSPNQN